MKKNTEEEVVSVEPIALITHDFQRQDLNELRDAVNALISR